MLSQFFFLIIISSVLLTKMRCGSQCCEVLNKHEGKISPAVIL